MTDVSIATMLFYTLLIIGPRINDTIRRDVNKYYMQDILYIPKRTSNRYTHLIDALSAFARIIISLFADFAWGKFYTIITLFPMYFLLFVTNIFSSVYFTKSMLNATYIITYSFGKMVVTSIFTVSVSFIKDQFTQEGTFDQFFDSWYIIFNIFAALSGFLSPLIFKNIVVKNPTTKNILMFLTPPLIISFLFFLLLIAYRKSYIIKKTEKKDFGQYVKGFFTRVSGSTEQQNNNRLRRIKFVLIIVATLTLWDIVTDQFATMVIDFADSGYIPKAFGSWDMNGGSLIDAINPIVVCTCSPILFYFVFPYMIPNWSIFKKMLFGFLFNLLSMMLSILFHLTNFERDCIDSSMSLNLFWYAIPCIMNALSEIIVFPLAVKEISSICPPEYVSLGICLIWSTNGIASLYCFIINFLPASEINRCLVFVFSAIFGFLLIYIANCYWNDVTGYEKKLEASKRE